MICLNSYMQPKTLPAQSPQLDSHVFLLCLFMFCSHVWHLSCFKIYLSSFCLLGTTMNEHWLIRGPDPPSCKRFLSATPLFSLSRAHSDSFSLGLRVQKGKLLYNKQSIRCGIKFILNYFDVSCPNYTVNVRADKYLVPLSTSNVQLWMKMMILPQ